jgi:signal transduction histidine kinase
MKGKTGILFTLLVCLSLGLAALIAMLARGAITQVEHASEEKASTLARTVVSAIEGVIRHGPDQEGRIYSILEEVSRDAEVVSVGIVHPDGEPLVVRGEAIPHLADPTGDLSLTRSGRRIVAVVPFDVSSGCMSPGACNCGPGACTCGGREQWDMPPGSYRLALVMEMDSADRVRAPLIAVAAVGIAVLLGLLVATGLLARSIAVRGQLARDVALEQQRRRSLESLGLVAAGLAHEIRNPLGAIRGYAQLLHEHAGDDESRGRAGLMLPELDRVAERLEEFLGFARKRKPAASPVDLAALAAEVVTFFKPDADAAGTALSLETPRGRPVVEGDAAELKELITNLVINALQACADGGEVIVRTARTATGVELTVIDDGPGIRPEDLPRLFEPYFTTKDRGSGLGLAISRRVAEDHGAVVTLENAPGRGAVARLTFAQGAAR